MKNSIFIIEQIIKLIYGLFIICLNLAMKLLFWSWSKDIGCATICWDNLK